MKSRQRTNVVPVNIVCGSTEYTIPDGHYACVKACVVGSEIFVINGVGVLRASYTAQTTNTGSKIRGSYSNGYGFQLATISNVLTDDPAFSYSSTTFDFTNSMDYTLPEGTTISGGSYCVELYEL